jgi:hypothetical protein
MCCFSRPVEHVANTQIFARSAAQGRQFLVYSMQYKAKDDLAMILPLPVPRDSKEDAVRFINLEKYQFFFDDLRAGFNPPRPAMGLGGFGGIPGGTGAAMPLKVVEVGGFEASFVPSIKDFARLDERFRLPTAIWEGLPRYKDAGFAVFKLKKGELSIHPMAFEFPRANPRSLFFPTIHIHDGKIYPRAGFDHILYCQPDPGKPLFNWRESLRPTGMFMQIKETQGLLEPRQHCYGVRMRGVLRNDDVLV